MHKPTRSAVRQYPHSPVRFALLIALLFVLAGCDAVQGIIGTGPDVTRIVITPANLQVHEGETYALNVVAYGEDDAPVDARLSWMISQSSAVPVNSSGTVTGLWTNGEVLITARARSGVTSNPVSLRVLQPRDFGYIRVTPSQLLLRVGDTARLSATVYSSTDEAMDLPVLWRFSEETEAITIDSRSGAITTNAVGGPFQVFA